MSNTNPYDHRPDEDAAKELLEHEQGIINESNCDMDDFFEEQEPIEKEPSLSEVEDILSEEVAEDMADERALLRNRRDKEIYS